MAAHFTEQVSSLVATLVTHLDGHASLSQHQTIVRQWCADDEAATTLTLACALTISPCQVEMLTAAVGHGMAGEKDQQVSLATIEAALDDVGYTVAH